MQQNVEKLHDFYSSQTGKVFAGILQKSIQKIWQINEHEKTAALGFCVPYSESFKKCENHVDDSVAKMQETELAFRDADLHKILAIHCLENSPYPQLALQEIYRALEPDGQLLLVIPNKKQSWKNTAISGESHYSTRDIQMMIIASKFNIKSTRQAVFHPPKMGAELADAANSIMQACMPVFGAVTIFHAEKKIFQNRGRPLKVTPSLLDKLTAKKAATAT